MKKKNFIFKRLVLLFSNKGLAKQMSFLFQEIYPHRALTGLESGDTNKGLVCSHPAKA